MAHQLCPVVVGREVELHALRQSFASVVAGEGQCVMLVGEPGIGKSRLAREVAGWATRDGLAVTTGRSISASASAAYRPVTEALLQLFRRRPLPDDPALQRWLPLLQPLLPIQPLLPTLVEPVPAADVPAGLRGEAVLQLLARACPTGVVVVLEDLHWADPDTVSLVEYLSANLAGTPVLLVVTMRDSPRTAALDVAGRQRGRPGVTILHLGRLGRDQAAEMVRACRPDAAGYVIDRIGEVSEGIPLLVEELLAAPGVPADFAATVRTRLEALPVEQREVIEAAAVLGRQFDWEILPVMSGHGDAAVADALAAGVESLLLGSHGTELRFRHALTREAVLDTVLPPRQRQLAAAGLAALTASAAVLDDARRELAADLALRAGDRHRGGVLLAESGRRSLSLGALATAADALCRAVDLLSGSSEQAGAELDLVAALALAGRVDEAAAAGGRLVTRLGSDPPTAGIRIEAHLRLAHAAVAASRWQMARHHIDEARRLSGAESSPAVKARSAVLDADVMMAADDYEAARCLVTEVLRDGTADSEVRCHALEILGRSHRLMDLPAARAAFERALVTAEAADRPLWRLRALHELGTIDLFDHAGVERLLQAHQAAERMGALSIVAILDLQLAAAYTCRWDLGACDAHAASAIDIAERQGLDQVRAKALGMLAGTAAMRADLDATERYAALTAAAGPGDRMLEGFCWGMRGLALLLAGQEQAAIEPWSRGMAILAKLPHAEPAAVRALWPLVLAARGDRRAQAAVDEARRLGVATFNLNQAMIGYAEAILAGRRGDSRRARELLTLADTRWTNCHGWSHLARLLAAAAAASDGWAEVAPWLTAAAEHFAAHGLSAMSRRCEGLQAGSAANPWSSAGITDREADVLRLVTEGLSNKEIATRLRLSPRTVEKHVESLLRKSGARSRAQLAARLRPSVAGPPGPGSPASTT